MTILFSTIMLADLIMFAFFRAKYGYSSKWYINIIPLSGFFIYLFKKKQTYCDSNVRCQKQCGWCKEIDNLTKKTYDHI
jgi:hypothetical protein